MLVERLIRTGVPPPYQLAVRHWWRIVRGIAPAEISLVRNLLGGCRTAVDIGANIGTYAYALSLFCDKVQAFEPLPCGRPIGLTKRSNIRLHQVALSNHRGTETLFVPIVNGEPKTGWASFNRAAGDVVAEPVSVKTLDEFELTDVDFIKVDVEGHELAVLAGAAATMATYRPLLLVEVEQRHLHTPIEASLDQIAALGYNGYFRWRGRVLSAKHFVHQQHQAPHLADPTNSDYVDSFFFASAHSSVDRALRSL